MSTERRKKSSASKKSRRGDDAPRANKRGRQSGRTKLKYKRYSAASFNKRQESGMYDSYIRDGIKLVKLAEGSTTFRFLPQTWSDQGEPFGLPVFVHYSVGPDKSAYLCLEKNKGEPCPICEYRAQLMNDGEKEAANEYRAGERIAAYVIDRDKPRDGVQLWLMPKSVDISIASMSADPKTSSLLFVDDPEEGYDVTIKRTGTGKTSTNYLVTHIDREPSPISEDEEEFDEIIDFITENPIPAVLTYKSAEYLEKLLNYGASSADEDDDYDDDYDDEEDDDRPRRSKYGSSRKSKKREDEDPDDDEFDEDEDDDEDDYDDDEDEDYDDEDDYDDDEDEDYDDEDEDDDYDDDEEDEDDDEDDDEDERPVKKSRRRAAPKKSSRRPEKKRPPEKKRRRPR